MRNWCAMSAVSDGIASSVVGGSHKSLSQFVRSALRFHKKGCASESESQNRPPQHASACVGPTDSGKNGGDASRDRDRPVALADDARPGRSHLVFAHQIVVGWATFPFCGYGLLSKGHPMSYVVLVVGALGIASAIYIIADLISPFSKGLRAQPCAAHRSAEGRRGGGGVGGGQPSVAAPRRR